MHSSTDRLYSVRSMCYLRQVEKDEAYIKAVVNLATVAEQIVKENNAIDIYEEYWEGARSSLHAPQCLCEQPRTPCACMVHVWIKVHAGCAQCAVSARWGA